MALKDYLRMLVARNKSAAAAKARTKARHEEAVRLAERMGLPAPERKAKREPRAGEPFYIGQVLRHPYQTRRYLRVNRVRDHVIGFRRAKGWGLCGATFRVHRAQALHIFRHQLAA